MESELQVNEMWPHSYAHLPPTHPHCPANHSEPLPALRAPQDVHSSPLIPEVEVLIHD